MIERTILEFRTNTRITIFVYSCPPFVDGFIILHGPRPFVQLFSGYIEGALSLRWVRIRKFFQPGLESGAVADRLEVGVSAGHFKVLGIHPDGAAQPGNGRLYMVLGWRTASPAL